MTIEELYKIIIEKRKNAIDDLRQKQKMNSTIAPEHKLVLKQTMSSLKGCIEAYEDLICLIAAENDLELPNFDCCEEMK